MPSNPQPGRLRGHRRAPLGRSPFAPTLPAIAAALVFAVATGVWTTFGPALPGGRWLAVHLFTLGVLTNVILGFSQHFSRTLTRTGAAPSHRHTVVLNLSLVVLLVGLPVGSTPAVGVGATGVTTGVMLSYLGLRRSRRAAVGARFGWVVRVYERAHGAFVHGAILGLLLGVGLLQGAWYGSGRLAHLHVNILGWGGLTLLGTLVFFGPTMTRTRIRPGADEVAARALRVAATALTAAVLLLLTTGIGGTAGEVARWLAAAGFAVFAVGVTLVCVPVARAAAAAGRSPAKPHVIALAVWFIVLVWADVLVVASGEWRYLEVLGIVALVGVLGQAILTTLGYVAPMLRSRSFAGRDVLLGRLERGAGLRAVVFNLAVGVVAAAATVDLPPGLTVAGRWSLVAVVLAQLVVSVWPVRGDPDAAPRSRIAARYRDADPSEPAPEDRP